MIAKLTVKLSGPTMQGLDMTLKVELVAKVFMASITDELAECEPHDMIPTSLSLGARSGSCIGVTAGLFLDRSGRGCR